MAGRWSGVIGFGYQVKTKPGVVTDDIVVRKYYGNIVRNSRRLDESNEKLNYDISVGNSISIVADPYARDHFFAMRYISWAGALWAISEVVEERPRLILTLGGVYNGPKGTIPGTP
jgi:hypothetical protein